MSSIQQYGFYHDAIVNENGILQVEVINQDNIINLLTTMVENQNLILEELKKNNNDNIVIGNFSTDSCGCETEMSFVASKPNAKALALKMNRRVRRC